MSDSIKSGEIWLDTEGKKIEAHGGAIFFENDTYYWYGENKEYTDGLSKVWTWGIRFYSSKDLYHWKDEGLGVAPDLEDKKSPLHPYQRIDRPHILFNKDSKKYIMWFKTSGPRACFTILSADNILGPYIIEKDNFRPLGKKAGDFDIAKDEKTGKAYLYFDGDHEGMITVALTKDYLDVEEKITLDFNDVHPPFCREAMAHFIYNNNHYIVTSGMTGYLPNPSEVAVSKDWYGPFNVIGNPHINDNSSSSFNSQISQIFKHPKKKDLYIALADRWVPEYEMTKPIYDSIVRAIGARFNPDIYKPTKEDTECLMNSPMFGNANTSKSTYVWLPIRFENNQVFIDWHDEWRIEDYE